MGTFPVRVHLGALSARDTPLVPPWDFFPRGYLQRSFPQWKAFRTVRTPFPYGIFSRAGTPLALVPPGEGL